MNEWLIVLVDAVMAILIMAILIIVMVTASRIVMVTASRRGFVADLRIREAETKAQVLFDKLLTPEQRKEHRATGQVSVPLPNGRFAKIGFQGPCPGRIQWPDYLYQCAVPKQSAGEWYPQTDKLISQLLNLRNNPDQVRAISGIPPLNMNDDNVEEPQYTHFQIMIQEIRHRGN